MQHIKITCLLISLIFTVSSCQQEKSISLMSTKKKVQAEQEPLLFEEDLETEPPQLESRNSASRNGVKARVIKHGNMTLKVKDLVLAKSLIDSAILAQGAYYELEDYHASKYNTSYNLRIRVLSEKFDQLVRQVESNCGQLTAKNINARDVTEEFVDIKLRLANKEAYLKQYSSLLIKAKSIKNILEIQEKMRQLESEIEAKKGRLNYLVNQANYSSLNIKLITESAVSSTEPKFLKQVSQALKFGLEGFLNFILILIRLWPFILLFILLWLIKPKIFSYLRKIRST